MSLSICPFVIHYLFVCLPSFIIFFLCFSSSFFGFYCVYSSFSFIFFSSCTGYTSYHPFSSNFFLLVSFSSSSSSPSSSSSSSSSSYRLYNLSVETFTAFLILPLTPLPCISSRLLLFLQLLFILLRPQLFLPRLPSFHNSLHLVFLLLLSLPPPRLLLPLFTSSSSSSSSSTPLTVEP